jgi:hypothetical protein
MNDLYEQETVTLPKDVIYAAAAALKAGLDNTEELLMEHDAARGRTTRKNKFIAEVYEVDMHNMKRVIEDLRRDAWLKD